MKKFLTITVLMFSAFLLFSPQAGYAWLNTNGGCLATGCHSATQVHGVPSHGFSTGNCAACHDGAAGKGNVLSSKCAGCHSNGEACPLIATPHGNPPACLACHTNCAPATTTTTTPANTTTTTPTETTTTTTASTGGIITIDPAEIKVDGTTDVTEDINVTIDASGLTEADLEGLEVDFSDACAQYITVNTVNYAITDKKVEGTVNITVKGDAPTTECTLTAKNTSGTIDVETTKFAITSTAAPECEVKSITPSSVRVGFGIFPRIQKFTFTFNTDVEALGITEDDIKVETANVTVFNAKISGNSITVWTILRGLKPDSTYFFNVGDCGRVSIDTKGFF